jgi:hypothetical protein
MTDMNDIAVRLGWVAINASRVETLVAFLQVALGSDETAIVGSPWSSNFEACKATYRRMCSHAEQRGDTTEAENCRLFVELLIELNSWMNDRHHVLHAIWEQDPLLDPGTTLGLRRRGQRTSGEWPVERLDALNRYLHDAHQMVMIEMGHQLRRGEPSRRE